MAGTPCIGRTQSGRECGAPAVREEEYCRHHLAQKNPELPRPDIITPIKALEEQWDAMQRQQKQLEKMLKDLDAVKQDLIRTAREAQGEQVARDQFNLTPEDIDKARLAARSVFADNQRRAISEAIEEAKSMAGDMITYTPPEDAVVPYGHDPNGGTKVWKFDRGIHRKYPRIVIDLYEQKLEALNRRESFRRDLGAKKVGEYSEVDLTHGMVDQILRRYR